jgi:GMP synthase (glutamine-hydrolysing)
MPTIACLHNLEVPFLGHAGDALRATGAELDERFVREGDPLPEPGEVDGIVAFGGEQSVRDIAADPLLAAEGALLREAVEREVPVLGVCLGAQLLAHVLGGSVAKLPRRMIAWAPLEPLAAVAGDPVLGHVAGAAGLHWNEDGFEPPPGAVELLRRPGTSGEAFRYGRCAWGVQFHAEVDEPALERWYRAWGAFALPQGGVTEAQARAGDAPNLPRQRALSEALFGGFARVVARARPAAA